MRSASLHATRLPTCLTSRFPTAYPSVMLAERTFWEKATAMHVFCRQQRRRGARLSRHWHDLVRLDDAGYAQAALTDRSLALAVARHKSAFFAEKDTTGRWIDYEARLRARCRWFPPVKRTVRCRRLRQNAQRRHVP